MFSRCLLHSRFYKILSIVRSTQICPLSSYITAQRDYRDFNSKSSLLYQLHEKNAQQFLENLNEELKQRKRRIEAEIEEYRMRGYPVPEAMSAQFWQLILTGPSSRRERQIYLKRLAEREWSLSEQEERSHEDSTCTTKLPCGLSVHDTESLLTYGSYAGYKALVFGQPLVMDLDYDLSDTEQQKTVLRLMNCYEQNMAHQNPFHIYFTGYKNSWFEKTIQMYGLMEKCFASFYENNFTNVFNTSDMIYLSPEGPPFTGYDCEKTYVIGAYVPIKSKKDKTLIRARELGIEAYRLPFFDYGIQKRDLGLNTVMDIMLEASLCHSWEEAIYRALVCTERSQELVLNDGTGARHMWKARYTKRLERSQDNDNITQIDSLNAE